MSSSFVRRSVCVAAALVLAASGVVVGSITGPGQILALPGASESTVVMVEPTRIFDTRYNIGLTGQVVAGASRELVVSGVINTYVEATATTIARQVVPAGATGVLLNVTAVSPTAAGFLSILPGTATGVPATAGLNGSSHLSGDWRVLLHTGGVTWPERPSPPRIRTRQSPLK